MAPRFRRCRGAVDDIGRSAGTGRDDRIDNTTFQGRLPLGKPVDHRGDRECSDLHTDRRQAHSYLRFARLVEWLRFVGQCGTHNLQWFGARRSVVGSIWQVGYGSVQRLGARLVGHTRSIQCECAPTDTTPRTVPPEAFEKVTVTVTAA